MAPKKKPGKTTSKKPASKKAPAAPAKPKAKPKSKAAAAAAKAPAHAAFAHVGLHSMAAAAPPAAAGAAPNGTLAFSVAKQGGPVATSVTVGSPGLPDVRLLDSQLTPGPATVPLVPGHQYSAIWQGGFVGDGRATLHIVATSAAGAPMINRNVDAVRPPLKDVFTVVVL